MWMILDCIALAGFTLAVFAAGISVGKFIEKVERLLQKTENEQDRSTHKNDRR